MSGSKPPDLSVIEFSDIHESVLLDDLGTTPAERKENAQKTNCFSALIENPPPCPLAGLVLWGVDFAITPTWKVREPGL